MREGRLHGRLPGRVAVIMACAGAQIVTAELKTEGNKDVVIYKIRVGDDTGEWTVSRRFRNFETLHRALRCLVLPSSACLPVVCHLKNPMLCQSWTMSALKLEIGPVEEWRLIILLAAPEPCAAAWRLCMPAAGISVCKKSFSSRHLRA